MSNKHLFCFGLGYTATKLADKLLDAGWRVSGTCRTADKFPALKQMGITPYLFSNELPLEGVWDLGGVTHILLSIPPSGEGDIVLKHHIADLQNLPDLEWVGYLSTTGVYGNHNGDWVDEETPVLPVNQRSELRVEAEKNWLKSGLPVHIFRLSGIYGPGRSAIDALRRGAARRIAKEEQYFSRIHVDDIVKILAASINKPNSGSIYNCADDLPSSQEEVIACAARLLGMEPPPLIPFAEAELSDMARSFYSSSRKVSNRKIKDELGVKLEYPDYKAGLNSLSN